MNTEVMKTEAKTLACMTPVDMGTDVLASDIIIPKLLLMQGLSDLVNARKAAQGDMVRSINGEILGNPEKPVEFIPIEYTRTWLLEEKVGSRYEYRKQIARNASNDRDPWEYREGGTEWKRKKQINLLALLVSDIHAERAELEKLKTGSFPDPEKALLPVVISFRATSYTAGRKILTSFTKAKSFNVPVYTKRYHLKCYADKNDQGQYYVFDLDCTGDTTPEDMAVCQKWLGIITQTQVKVDESDLGESQAPSPEMGQF